MRYDPSTQEPFVVWRSFDSVAPEPVYMPGGLYRREQIETLFADGNVFTWDETGGTIRFEDDGPEDAERLELRVVEGVNHYAFTYNPYMWEYDDDEAEELGWTAKWEPGVGLVPVAPPVDWRAAVERIVEGLDFGYFTPDYLNSWAEYAEYSDYMMPRIWWYAGVGADDEATKEQVARTVDRYLRDRATQLPTEGTVTADELTAGTLVHPNDLYSGSRPVPPKEILRVKRVGDLIELTTMGWRAGYQCSKIHTVRSDRRFRKA